MALKTIMNYEDLIKRLFSHSKQFTYTQCMETYWTNLIRSGGDNISLPSVGVLSEISPSYKADMINLYNGTFGLFDEVNVIPDDVKVCQAAVLDGLCFGYEVATDTASLYSMNMSLFDFELEEKLLKSIISANTLGQIKALRIDIEYSPVNKDNFECSLVSHRKVIDDENIVLIPFSAVFKLSNMMETYINSGLVLKTKQIMPDADKVRCITEKIEVLQKYCDSEEAVKGLKSIYYPLNGFLYAPVVGAPSTTAMMTKVDLFKLAELKMLRSIKEVNELGVQKPKDPVVVEVEELVIKNYILHLQELDDNQYESFVEKLPKTEKLSSFADRGISDAAISGYLHSIKEADRKKILKGIPNSEELVSSKVSVFNSCRVATEEEMKDLENLLKKNMCKILIRKSGGDFSSVTCSNNKDKLAAVYGKDYFKYYESFGVKAWYVAWFIEKNGIGDVKLLGDVLNYVGFDISAKDLISKIQENGGSTSEQAIKNLLYEIHEKPIRQSSKGNSILVRGLTARITNTGEVKEYTKSIDPLKVVRVLVYE